MNLTDNSYKIPQKIQQRKEYIKIKNQLFKVLERLEIVYLKRNIRKFQREKNIHIYYKIYVYNTKGKIQPRIREGSLTSMNELISFDEL